MTYAELIKKVRLDAGLRQYQFAELIGVSKVHLSLVERGHSKIGLQLLEKVAEFKKVPLSVLLWNTVVEADVQEENAELFRKLKPTTDMIFKSIFNI